MLCPGWCAQPQARRAETSRVRRPRGLRSPNSDFAPHQQLRRQGPERPCAKWKVTAGVGRVLPASMMRGCPSSSLLADAKLADDLAIPVRVALLQVVEETSADRKSTRLNSS